MLICSIKSNRKPTEPPSIVTTFNKGQYIRLFYSYLRGKKVILEFLILQNKMTLPGLFKNESN